MTTIISETLTFERYCEILENNLNVDELFLISIDRLVELTRQYMETFDKLEHNRRSLFTLMSDKSIHLCMRLIEEHLVPPRIVQNISNNLFIGSKKYLEKMISVGLIPMDYFNFIVQTGEFHLHFDTHSRFILRHDLLSKTNIVKMIDISTKLTLERCYTPYNFGKCYRMCNIEQPSFVKKHATKVLNETIIKHSHSFNTGVTVKMLLCLDVIAEKLERSAVLYLYEDLIVNSVFDLKIARRMIELKIFPPVEIIDYIENFESEGIDAKVAVYVSDLAEFLMTGEGLCAKTMFIHDMSLEGLPETFATGLNKLKNIN